MTANPTARRCRVVLLLTFVAIATLLSACMVPSVPGGQQTFNYDFEDPGQLQDWQLEASFWTHAAIAGGHALRGQGHGFARLSAHEGDIAALRFRFRFDSQGSAFHANLMESFTPDHTRYLVAFGASSVKITRQQGAAFTELGSDLALSGPLGQFHQAEILLGGGSIDVFVDGVGIIGVDDPAVPPAGAVSFESLDSSLVHIDDVEVVIGPETAPHPRAPRPPSALPPGPNVGPFVGGSHTGDIVLTGNDQLVLSQGSYTLIKGNITLRDNARLRIEQGAALIFDRGDSPLFHWGIDLFNSAALEIPGGTIGSKRALVRIDSFGTTTIDISNSRPWIHFINAGGNAVVTIRDTRLVTDIGGSIQLSGNALADVRDSQLGAVALALPAGSLFRAKDLRPGTYASFDLQTATTLTGTGIDLKLQNVELVADTLGEGPFERGWVLFTNETADVQLKNSTLRKIVIEFTQLGPDLSLSGLRVGQATDLTVGTVVLKDVTVTGQWGFFLHGTRRATFNDCQALWFFLFDTSEVTLRNSTMNEFDPRNYTGTVHFDDGSWTVGGEIIGNNDFLMTGTATFAPEVRTVSWDQSAVTRRYPIRVETPAGAPMSNVTVILTRAGKTPVSGVTDGNGRIDLDLRFVDQDYTLPWQLTTSAGHGPMDVDFFSATPVIVR